LDLSSCSNLKNIEIDAFQNNKIKKLDLSNCINLKTIIYSSFKNNKIETLKLPDSIEKIENYTFEIII